MAYPSTPITFTTKVAGNTIVAGFFNDPQTEITAIETALLTTGLAHNLNASGDNTRLLGSSGTRWIIHASQVSTGTVPVGVLARVSTLTDASTIALDASLGPTFRVVPTTNRILGVPTNAVDGQRIIVQHVASSAALTLTLSTGVSGGWRYGTDVTALTATSSGKTDYFGAIYNAASTVWDVIGVVKGY